MLIDVRPPEKLAQIAAVKAMFERVGTLWDSLTPRERVLKFHIAHTMMAYKSWKDMTSADNHVVMTAAAICGLDHDRLPDPSSFSAPAQDKVETKK